MDVSLLTDFCSGLLPTGVSFSAGFETNESSEPAPRDAAVLTSAGTRRAREFAVGRWHARVVLRKLGIDDAPLGRRVDGAPTWPEGVVGSIAHTSEQGRLFAVAAAAPSTLLTAIGIDVEAPGRIAARAWPALLTSAELTRVLALEPVERSREVIALWCAKEAVAKAMRPDCEIKAIGIEHDRDAARFVAQLPSPAEAAPSSASLGPCVGRVLDHAGWTWAVAIQARQEASLRWAELKAGEL